MAADPGGEGAQARRLREAVRTLLLAHRGLGGPHADALLALLAGGEMTVTALAAQLRIDRTNVSRLCGRMVADGEIVRQTHPEDGRAVLVRLTPLGERRARQVDADSAAHFGQVAARLGPYADAVASSLRLLADAMAAGKEKEETP